MSSVLIPAEQIPEPPPIPSDVLIGQDEDSRLALRRHLLFMDPTACAEAGLSLSEADRFYNAYYWLLIFSKRIQRRIGPEAGFEQQVFQMLESAPESIDWDEIEPIDQAADRAA